MLYDSLISHPVIQVYENSPPATPNPGRSGGLFPVGSFEHFRRKALDKHMAFLLLLLPLLAIIFVAPASLMQLPIGTAILFLMATFCHYVICSKPHTT